MNVTLLTPYKSVLHVRDLPAFTTQAYILHPFDELTLLFLDTYAKLILSDKSINRFPEIAALGFWLRRSNLNKIKSENPHLFENKLFISAPLGKVLHICPANVDTMFFYSFTISILAGNRNILRLSNRMDAPHMMTLFSLLNQLLSEERFSVLQSYINIISYGHEDNISEFLSQNVNARMIWGGDNTIKVFKRFNTAPRTKDIVFADRISLLCINCASYLTLNAKELDKFADLFFNDAYTFDQMGCSSPQTIYLLGNDDEYTRCADTMQGHLKKYIENNYEAEIETLASLKLNRAVDDIIDERINKKFGDNYCTFVQLKDGRDDELFHSCGGGYFYLKHIKIIRELRSIITAKLQTVSYFGLSDDDLNQLQLLANNEGIDRIVPLGMALNFNYIWDGYNLLDELSKKVFIR